MRFKLPGAALLGLFLLTSCERSPTELQLLVPRLEIDKTIAQELARLLDDTALVSVSLVESPDPEKTSLESLVAGTADLALVFNNEDFHPEVTTVAPLYPTVLHIAQLSTLSDLEPAELFGKHTVFAGPPGSVSRRLLIGAATRFGIEPGDIRFVYDNNVCPEVITVFAPIEPKNLERLLEECGEYELRSLGSPDELGKGSRVDGAALLNPKIRPFIIPSDTYGDITPQPVVTLAVDKMLVSRADLPDTVIYDLLREVLRVQPALAALHPALFSELSDNFELSKSTFVIHPGALAYIERDAPSVYERYSGIAEVAVTLLIGLLSGTFAVLRIYQIRRKNRIDVFYKDIMAIRSSVEGATDIAVRKKAISDVRRLQNKAFDMLIDEKLAADESFRIFVTLSNDVVLELRDADRAWGKE